MTDLNEIFLRHKQKEQEDEYEASNIVYAEVLNTVIEPSGRLVFESKRDSCV